MKASLRLMLLGIALLLFGLAFPIVENLFVPFVYLLHLSRYMFDLIGSIFPLAGLILTFVGFFKRD